MQETEFAVRVASAMIAADLCIAIDDFIDALMKLYLIQLELERELAACEMVGWEC